MNLADIVPVQLPKFPDPRGSLTVLEAGRQVPFDIKRVFYLYDVPGGETRAGHALRTCQQFIIAASGSFDVVLDDGKQRVRHNLNRSYYGILVPPMVWRELENFSSSSVCLVLASEYYSAEGYYRTYEDFKRATQGASRGTREAPAARASMTE